MNDLLADLQARVYQGLEIDSIFPMDLTGYAPKILDQVLYIYQQYGSDPERRELCRQKRALIKEVEKREVAFIIWEGRDNNASG